MIKLVIPFAALAAATITGITAGRLYEFRCPLPSEKTCLLGGVRTVTW
jgi:hypothetical protein